MRRSLLLVAIVLGLGAPAAVAAPVIGGPPVPAPVGEAAGVCDPIDPAHCLLPFPNDHFTVADPTTDTGRRVALSPLALPTNAAGKPWDPTEWNRNDGFSPGSGGRLAGPSSAETKIRTWAAGCWVVCMKSVSAAHQPC